MILFPGSWESKNKLSFGFLSEVLSSWFADGCFLAHVFTWFHFIDSFTGKDTSQITTRPTLKATFPVNHLLERSTSQKHLHPETPQVRTST